MSDNSRANILFLMSDQHTSYLMGCAGASYVQTPNLDRLAQMGTRFENAYCSYAHCVPSRASMMSGLEPYKIPCHDNGAPLPSDLPTWAHMARDLGYHTVLNGKMHFVGDDFLHGFHEHLNEPACQVAGCRWGTERPDPRKGKEYWAELHFEGDPVYERRMGQELPKVKDTKAYFDDHDAEQPFCYALSFSGPHYPMVCDEAMYEKYKDVEIPEVLLKHDMHPHLERWYRIWGFDRFSATETDAARRCYLAMIETIDTWFGEVLDHLEKLGKLDNTYIIYTADHGEMWGEHGLWGKQVFFDESSKVPLIMAGPDIQAGQVIEQPVSLLDIYPTLRDMIGHVHWDVPLDGRSLLPAAKGLAELGLKPIFNEYHGPDVKGPARMIRLGQYKLNYYHTQPIECFDLKADPRECNNLAENPDFAEIKEVLMRELTKDFDPFQMDQEIRTSQNRRTLIAQTYDKGTVTAL